MALHQHGQKGIPAQLCAAWGLWDWQGQAALSRAHLPELNTERNAEPRKCQVKVLLKMERAVGQQVGHCQGHTRCYSPAVGGETANTNLLQTREHSVYIPQYFLEIIPTGSWLSLTLSVPLILSLHLQSLACPWFLPLAWGPMGCTSTAECLPWMYPPMAPALLLQNANLRLGCSFILHISMLPLTEMSVTTHWTPSACDV